jgi:hypothetical protein
MLAASLFGIFFVPMLYVVFQQLREWVAAPKPQPIAEAKTSAPEPSE